jgi:hypothetical protein
MAHNRKYVPGGVALVKGRLKNSHKVVSQDEIDSFLIESGFCEGAPFRWVTLMYRYGPKNKTVPSYQRIDKKYGDLPLAVEIKMEILEWADKNNLALMRDIFMIGALDALIHAGKKYDRPTQRLETERAKYGTIPETVEECERLYRQ